MTVPDLRCPTCGGRLELRVHGAPGPAPMTAEPQLHVDVTVTHACPPPPGGGEQLRAA